MGPGEGGRRYCSGRLGATRLRGAVLGGEGSGSCSGEVGQSWGRDKV